jgi:predicted dehydrogenase
MVQKYAFEYEKRLRIGVVGCGEHAARNILPALQYAPVELVAACDLDRERAEVVGRSFGAQRAYTDFVEMIQSEALDAVYMVVSTRRAPGGDGGGGSPYPPLAIRAMEAGAHVWVEKPPADTLAQAEAMVAASRRTGKILGVGYKRMFLPTVVKAREIMATAAFGAPSALDYTYRLGLRPHGAPVNTDLSHPMGLVLGLMGPAESIYFERQPRTGAASAIITFLSGALGHVFFPGRPSRSGPAERAMVVGDGAHLVIDNVMRLTYFRRVSEPGVYGREPTFIGKDDDAPLFWEPEFTLGQMYNKNIFLIGYVGEVSHFAESVLAGREPERAGAADLLEIMRWTEALHRPSGTLTRISAPAGAPAAPVAAG